MDKDEITSVVFMKLMDRIAVQSELANSWTKHLITTQSALVIALGFLLKLGNEQPYLTLFYLIFISAVAILSAKILSRVIVRQLQWEGEYIEQIKKLRKDGVPDIFGAASSESPFKGKGYVARQIHFLSEAICFAWYVALPPLITYILS